MHLSVARAILLCAGAVSALLQNVTVDDTSPEIVYEGLTFQCNADGAALCGPQATVGLFNQSATFTSGPIMFNFTGVAYYATLDIFGVASVILDGATVKTLNKSDLTSTTTNLTENVFGTGLANVPHALVINPASTTTATVLGLDRLVYTASLPDKKKTHVGAIVGGVMAGLAVILGLLLTALFARRRKLILRRNQRKTAVLNGMAAARSRNHVHAGGGDDDAKELPSM